MANQYDKDQVIRSIYYDEDGFDNVKIFFEKSKKAMPSITLDDVKHFLAKQTIRQTKKYRGFNSYVAEKPLTELQVDLADFTKSAEENNGFRYLLTGIDVFSKKVHAVPIRTKQLPDVLLGFTEILDKIGIPEHFL